VYKRIAGALGLDIKSGHARVKRKLDECVLLTYKADRSLCVHSLQSTFKGHMKRLRRTGEGVTDDDDASQYYFIDRAGPDHDTPERARNIWEEIRADFKFFPNLYRIWHGRPNLVPICATTALTPHNYHETIMIQGAPPSSVAAQNSHDIPIDPVLLALDHPACSSTSATTQDSHDSPIDWPPSDEERDTPSSQPVTQRQPNDTSDKENVHPPGSQVRRSSHFGRIVATTPTIPRKRGAEDDFLDLTRNMVNAMSQQTRDSENRKLRKLLLKERQSLLDEFKVSL